MTLQVAVRSNEPYRLQCYGFLSAVASIGGLGEHPGCSTSHQLQSSLRRTAVQEMSCVVIDAYIR